MHASAVAEMGGFSYTVHKGDTISSIARRFHASQASLVEMNHGSHRLRVGQRFTIVASGGATHRKTHVAKARVNTSKRASSTRRVKLAYSNR